MTYIIATLIIAYFGCLLRAFRNWGANVRHADD